MYKQTPWPIVSILFITSYIYHKYEARGQWMICFVPWPTHCWGACCVVRGWHYPGKYTVMQVVAKYGVLAPASLAHSTDYPILPASLM